MWPRSVGRRPRCGARHWWPWRRLVRLAGRTHPRGSRGVSCSSSRKRARTRIRFLQLTDASEEESHYWGDIEPGAWALDIWIGSPDDRGHGLGAEVMKLALGSVFDQHGAEMLVIDPAVDNRGRLRSTRNSASSRRSGSASSATMNAW